VETAFDRVARTRASGAHLETARHLALVAEHLPWRADLWEPAGRGALKGEDPQLAIEYFKQAAAVGALSQPGYLWFGEAYQVAGNPYTARQIWEAANRIFGPSHQFLARIAGLQREAKDYPALIETLKQDYQLAVLGPSDPATLTELNLEIGMLLAAVDPAAAPPYLLQVVESDPGQTAASSLAFAIQRTLPSDNPVYTRMVAGRKLASMGHWDLATYAFQAVTEAQPGYAEAWAYLGEARQHLNPPDAGAARAALEQAYALNPDSLPANALLAVYWQRQGEPEQAFPYLVNAKRVDPENPDLLVDLGAATAALGNLEEALTYLQTAIQATNGDPVYLRTLAAFCIRYNHDLLGTALPAARQALLADPYEPASLDMMGQVLYRLGDVLNAQRFLSRALSLDPDYAPVHLHLGLIYRLQGKTSQAATAFQQAIALAPDSPTADQATRLLAETNVP
jgi:tetratricopeptide (TPR) repeat protein